jgi:hypothetical protein
MDQRRNYVEETARDETRKEIYNNWITSFFYNPLLIIMSASIKPHQCSCLQDSKDSLGPRSSLACRYPLHRTSLGRRRHLLLRRTSGRLGRRLLARRHHLFCGLHHGACLGTLTSQSAVGAMVDGHRREGRRRSDQESNKEEETHFKGCCSVVVRKM